MKHFLLAATILLAPSTYAEALKDTVFYNGAWSMGFTSLGNVIHANSKNKDRIFEKCSSLYSAEFCEENLVYSKVMNYRGKYRNYKKGNASYMMARLKNKPFIKNVILEEERSVSKEELNRVCREVQVLGRNVNAYYKTRVVSKLVAVKTTELEKDPGSDLADAYYYTLRTDGERFPGSEWQVESTGQTEILLQMDRFMGLELTDEDRSQVCQRLEEKLTETLKTKSKISMNDYVFGHENYIYSTVTNTLMELNEIFN